MWRQVVLLIADYRGYLKFTPYFFVITSWPVFSRNPARDNNMGGRQKSTFKSPPWVIPDFPIHCCSVLCNNKALNFVITRASPWNNRFTPVVITRAILLLHGLCIELYQNCLGLQKRRNRPFPLFLTQKKFLFLRGGQSIPPLFYGGFLSKKSILVDFLRCRLVWG